MNADLVRAQLAEALKMWDSDRADLIAGVALPTARRIVADELLTVADMAAERERVEGGDTGVAFREFALYLRARAGEVAP